MHSVGSKITLHDIRPSISDLPLSRLRGYGPSPKKPDIVLSNMAALPNIIQWTQISKECIA